MIGMEVVFFSFPWMWKTDSSSVFCASSKLKLRIKWLSVSQRYCTSRYSTRVAGAHLMTRMCAVLLKTLLTACSAGLVPYSIGFLLPCQGNLLQESPGFINEDVREFRINFNLSVHHRTGITGPQMQPEMISKCMHIRSFMARKMLGTALLLLLQCSWVSVKASVCTSF